uniref:FBA_2 domain-containing protein n=1 Tax=Caenorhabditis tropicalis TaxID=1561998 RepID=A0A1I7SXG4_9PELO
MDLLVFDAKRNRNGTKTPVALNKEELSEMLGCRQIISFMNGGLVQIFDETVSHILNESAGIGQWMDDGRKENHGVSQTCFDRNEEENTFRRKDNYVGTERNEKTEAMKWAERFPIVNSLVLSPMETILLTLDWKIMKLKNGKTY